MQPKRGFANVNGTRLHYEVAGSGPTLVLVHGGAMDMRMWDDQMGPFTQRYRVVRYDVRGHGRSALPSGENYSRPDELKALLDYLGIRRASIVGLSMGGGIAIEFALSYPDATDALVPIGSGLGGYSRSDEWLALLETRKSIARNSGAQAAREFWLSTYVFGSALETPNVGPRVIEMVSDYSGWAWANDDPFQALDPPPIERLGEITAPTLVMAGERDIPDCLRIADLLERRIPGAKMAIMPGVGHACNMEDPGSFNRTVLRFLDGVRLATPRA